MTNRLLIIDDDPIMGDFIRLLIGKAVGKVNTPEILCALSIEAAEALIAEQRFTAILLDLKLPTSDVSETIERIPDFAARWDTPIIVISAHAEDTAIMCEEVMARGAHDFISKKRAEKDFLALGEKIDRAMSRGNAGWRFIKEHNHYGQK